MQVDNVETFVRDTKGDYAKSLFLKFLNEYTENDVKIYSLSIQHMVCHERNSFPVNFSHLDIYCSELAVVICDNYYRVYPFLCKALVEFSKQHIELPKNKELFINFTNVTTSLKIRELNNEKIGRLTRIVGQVVRTYPVHPELVFGTFMCAECQTIMSNIEQQFKYTQPSICTNKLCNNSNRFVLVQQSSKFVDFQKVRIQETQAELPRGSVPRRGDVVESAQAGDKCTFTGTLIAIPDVASLSVPGAKAEPAGMRKAAEGTDGVTGLKSLGVRELNYRHAFLACNVESHNRKYTGGGNNEDHAFSNEEELTPESVKKQMSASEWHKVYDMTRDRNLYSNMCNSLFPTIHGNEDIKRGILLMLFGGVAKVTEEKTKLRGDINVCVVGDPSTAKSQFLRHVEKVTPRTIYTSGKASTAAGLTAAVIRDEDSHEFVIEAGALMLADNGVCCIDEFDKMEWKDQVAIHEAMEQQTITITKAGIKATLNARASILAAANPINGRYDKSRSLKSNINFSAPIMSRFDLFFVLVDDCDEVTDYAISKRIVDLHTLWSESVDRLYSVEEIRRYITFARQFQPKISKESMEYMTGQYKRLRLKDACGAAKTSWRITVRQLESLIRLSEAMARVYCQEEVKPKHVKEALRLLEMSIVRIEQGDVILDDDNDPIDEDVLMDEMDLHSEIHSEMTTQTNTQVSKISNIEYRRLANILVSRLRKNEEENVDNWSRSKLVLWYLDEIETNIECQEQLLRSKNLVEKVIDRLLNKDHVLIQLVDNCLRDRNAQPVEKIQETDNLKDNLNANQHQILVVHPNYVVE